MGFIRIKKRKRNEIVYRYAYVAENTWDKDKESPRQKIICYLGKVLRLTKVEDISFLEYYNITNLREIVDKKNFNEILDMVIEVDLKRHGFQNQGDVFVLEGVRYYPELNQVRLRTKNVVLEMNDGFFCEYNLKKLYNFKLDGTIKNAKEFAKILIDTGIRMNKELFIALFEKIKAEQKMGFEKFKEEIGY